MTMTEEPKFSFVAGAQPQDTFAVVNFQGVEGLSRCYQFDLNLVSTNPDLDLKKTMQQPAVFTIHREDDDIPFWGMLSQFEIRQAFQDYVFYKAVLVPKVWWLGLTHHNQVFLDKTTPEILTRVLEDGGLSSLDFELRLQKDYTPWEYVCQYQESHFDFVSRWMEREGIYYFFEQTDQGEKPGPDGYQIGPPSHAPGTDSLLFAPIRSGRRPRPGNHPVHVLPPGHDASKGQG